MSFDIANTQCEEKLIFLQGQNWPKNRISPSNEIWPLQNQIYGQSNYLTSKVCIFVAFFWQIEHQFTPLIATWIITNPKIHLLVKRIFHAGFFHFQTKKAQQIAGSPVSKRIWICLYRCFKDLKQDKFKFYYKSKFLLHSNQGRYHFFLFSEH